MAFYDYYHQNLGGGRDIAPPQPFYQPQPSWGGPDYYRAQAQAADSSLYEYGLERVQGQNFSQGGSGMGMGAGIEEAKILHGRAYFGEMQMMMPVDIGAAAAYEAWRNWSAYQGTYMQPLSADRGRQREAFLGLAIGEAARLWGYTANPMDTQGRLVAVEGAAATASKIFVQSAAGLGAGGGLGMGGMGGSPLMGGGGGLGVGGLGMSPGIGGGAMGGGNYLDVPQRPFMRRRSMSDIGAAQMLGGGGYGGMGAGMGSPMGGMDGGMGGQMGGMAGRMGAGMGSPMGGMGAGMGGMGGGMGGMGTGAGMGYGGGMGGGMGYGGSSSGGMGYGSSSGRSNYGGSNSGAMGYGGGGYGSSMPSAAGGMGYGGMGGGNLPGAYGGAGGAGYGGAGYGMGGGGLASSAGLLAGELEGRHRRRRRSGSRSRHRHRHGQGSMDGGYGSNGGYGGYGGYGGQGGLTAGLAQGYASSR